MKVTGEATLKAGPEQLWEAFNDPAALVHTIPGCQRLETDGEDSYKMTLSAGVAAIKGVYDGRVQLLDKVEPRSLRMVASGSGGPGTIEVSVNVNLEPQGDGSHLTYEADATVGGMIGGVSQRMLASVGKRLANEFFTNLDDYIARGGAAEAVAAPGSADTAPAEGVPAPGAPAGEPAGVQAGTAAPATGVFERPTTAPAAGASSSELLKGAAGGGALVLLGVIAGGLLGRRRN